MQSHSFSVTRIKYTNIFQKSIVKGLVRIIGLNLEFGEFSFL